MTDWDKWREDLEEISARVEAWPEWKRQGWAILDCRHPNAIGTKDYSCTAAKYKMRCPTCGKSWTKYE